jgi:hypothetical protein
MWTELSDALLRAVRSDPRVASLARTLQDRVMAGELTPAAAATAILRAFLSGGPDSR